MSVSQPVSPKLSERLLPFLEGYPHPAFTLQLSDALSPHLDINYLNPVLSSFLGTTTHGASNFGAILAAACSTVGQSARLLDWAYRSTLLSTSMSSGVAETFDLDLSALSSESRSTSMQIELTQTRLGDLLVCTSVPRSAPIPAAHQAPIVLDTAAESEQEPQELPRLDSVLDMPESTEDGRPLATSSGSCLHMLKTYTWDTTPLGPRTRWSDTLIASVNYALANPFPTCLWWGGEAVAIYNDAYATLAGSRHPSIFGQPAAIGWPELWPALEPLAQQVWKGETIHKEEDLLFLGRLTDAHLPEETYHNWSYVPVTDSEGVVRGFVNLVSEVTKNVVTNRRMQILRELSTSAALARDQLEFAASVMRVLDTFKLDAPFAALYSATVAEAEEDRRSSHSHSESILDVPREVHLVLRGRIGVKEQSAMPSLCTFQAHSSAMQPSPADVRQDLPPILSTASMEHGEPTRSFQPVLPSTFRDRDNQLSAASPSIATFSELSSRSSASSPSRIATVVSDWPFEKAFSTQEVVHMSLPASVIDRFETRCWDEHAREAVLIPLVADGSDVPSCMLVLGLNSRLPYDDGYREWIDLIRLSLNALLKAVKGRESDALRASQLAQLDEAKTVFFSNASHEFRTPLTLIQGPVQDAILDTRDKQTKSNLEMAMRNIKRLQRLVDSLMDFSKLAAKKLEGKFRPVALGPFTANLASLFDSVIGRTKLKYINECNRDDRSLCYVDLVSFPDVIQRLRALKQRQHGKSRAVM